jgi:hypothetical protein
MDVIFLWNMGKYKEEESIESEGLALMLQELLMNPSGALKLQKLRGDFKSSL